MLKKNIIHSFFIMILLSITIHVSSKKNFFSISRNNLNSTNLISIEIKNIQKVWRIFNINGTLYKENDKCDGGCDKGICLNSTCICKQGLTGNNCSMTYNDNLGKGFKVKNLVKYYIIVGAVAMLITLLYAIFKK